MLRHSAKVAHIDHVFCTVPINGKLVTAMRAKCGQLFLEPSKRSYWMPLGRRRVCGHCARAARREARELLAAANGLP